MGAGERHRRVECSGFDAPLPLTGKQAAGQVVNRLGDEHLRDASFDVTVRAVVEDRRSDLDRCRGVAEVVRDELVILDVPARREVAGGCGDHLSCAADCGCSRIVLVAHGAPSCRDAIGWLVARTAWCRATVIGAPPSGRMTTPREGRPRSARHARGAGTAPRPRARRWQRRTCRLPTPAGDAPGRCRRRVRADRGSGPRPRAPRRPVRAVLPATQRTANSASRSRSLGSPSATWPSQYSATPQQCTTSAATDVVSGPTGFTFTKSSPSRSTTRNSPLNA